MNSNINVNMNLEPVLAQEMRLNLEKNVEYRFKCKNILNKTITGIFENYVYLDRIIDGEVTRIISGIILNECKNCDEIPNITRTKENYYIVPLSEIVTKPDEIEQIYDYNNNNNIGGRRKSKRRRKSRRRIKSKSKSKSRRRRHKINKMPILSGLI